MATPCCPAQAHLPEEGLNVREVLSQQAFLALHQQAHKLLLCTGAGLQLVRASCCTQCASRCHVHRSAMMEGYFAIQTA